MGYSVSVRFKNENEKQKMKLFLENNNNLIEQLRETEKYISHTNTPLEGEELGYAPKIKNLLGFYGSGIPRYIWNLCAWMAVKSSYRNKENDIFFYYDSDKMKVTFDINNRQNTVVSEEGIRVILPKDESLPKKFIKALLALEPDYKKQDEIMEKLNENWKSYNLENKLNNSTSNINNKTKMK